jgi:hypothetical protein
VEERDAFENNIPGVHILLWGTQCVERGAMDAISRGRAGLWLAVGGWAHFCASVLGHISAKRGAFQLRGNRAWVASWKRADGLNPEVARSGTVHSIGITTTDWAMDSAKDCLRG